MTDLEKPFRCLRRDETFGMADRAFPTKDHWRVEPNGDHTCSYCGSLSEDDLVQIMEKFVAGEAGYHFDPSTKDYKIYASRPGVHNAKQGGIKFYKPHIDQRHPDFEKRKRLFDEAMKRWRALLEERFGAAPIG